MLGSGVGYVVNSVSNAAVVGAHQVRGKCVENREIGGQGARVLITVVDA